ncbi:MAG: noncanonical pyrimidine nucleotidase, YjjG family [Ruminococcaceae bacterium]|nr:noncanonical pyrimidine nucleotidase, YjjG family [Oscillospiraceae bacterium]
MSFKVILWDIDGTLLDFHAAEVVAIRALFAKHDLGICTDEMLADYRGINRTYWERLELGVLTKPEVLVGRFQEFFGKYGLNTDCAAAFNDDYQLALGDTVHFFPGAWETVTALKGKLLQCVVTNGTAIAQHRKLTNSRLDTVFDEVFISDEIGFEKPSLSFFDAVWAKIGSFDPDEVLIVGDSLTSDMQGGINAGIHTCWFNPAGAPLPQNMRIDYDIRCISEVLEICNMT